MTDMPKGEPIWMPCEGSNAKGHESESGAVAMCRMCGEWIPCTWDGVVEAHRRDDIIARVKRGDFG